MIKFDDSFTNTQLSDLHLQEEERFVTSRASQLGLPYINLHNYTINPEALRVIKEERSREVSAVGFELRQNKLAVAARDPMDPKVQDLFQELQKQRYRLEVYLCSTNSLQHAWERYEDISNATEEKRGVFEINAKDIARLSNEIKVVDDVGRILEQINNSGNVRRISETLELIFAGALSLDASDIHIEPEEAAIRLRYRLDGVLNDIVDLDNYMFSRLMSRLKLLSGMILNTKDMAQDGRFTFDIEDRQIEIRSSIIPGALGESIVMRLLDPSLATFNINNIDLNPYIDKIIRHELKKPNGLIITTGPTGSGKTTALYAFLQETHTEGVKIITLENPVEYKLEGIVQTQVSQDYSFATGLRAILRQDPDIIMVGEIRDREVAETAIHAAQTGHLVFSTLHTNNAIAAFPRLIDLGVDPRVMGTSINLIMGQRLVRLLCNECKRGTPATKDELRVVQYVMSTHPYPIEVPDPLVLYQAVGCKACNHTGFNGREGIFEGVLMDDAVEEAVLRDPREYTIREAARPQKIPSMLEDGMEKVVRGLTSLKELERVIEIPNVDEENLAGEPKQDTKIEVLEETAGDFSSHIV